MAVKASASITIFDVTDGADGTNFNWNILRGTGAMAKGTGTWDSGTFRDSTSGWTYGVEVPDSPILLSTGMSLTGKTTGSLYGFAQDKYSGLVNGQTYTISAWVYASAGDKVRFQLWWYKGIDIAYFKEFSITTTGWQKLSATLAYAGESNKTVTIGYFYINPASADTTAYVVGLKMELGATATEWAPNQEDIQGKTGDTGVGISSVTPLYYASSSSTAPSAPTATVTTNSKTTYSAWNKAMPTYSSSYPYYYTCSEVLRDDGTYAWTDPVYASALTDANQTAQDAKDTVDNLEVGGRNLLQHTATFDGWGKGSGITVTDGVVYWAETDTLAWKRIYSRNEPLLFSDIAGKQVTVSLEAKSSGTYTSGRGLLIQLGLCSASSTSVTLYKSFAASNQSGKTSYPPDISSEWQKFSATATFSADGVIMDGSTTVAAWNGSGSIDDDTRCYVQIYNYALTDLYVRNVKLEYGNKATDWTAAPEDTEEEIANAAKTATNYLKVQDGLIVGDHTASTLGKNVLIDDDSVDIRNGSTVLASYGDTITLGKTSGWNTCIDSSAVDIQYNGTIYASFGTTATIGLASARNIYIDSDSVDIRNGSTVLASFGETITIGPSSGYGVTISSDGGLEFNQNGSSIGSIYHDDYGLNIYENNGSSGIRLGDSAAQFVCGVSLQTYADSITMSTSSGTLILSGTAGSVTTPTIYTTNWFRSYNATGWYNETYGGGIYMTDSTYVRVYGGKQFWCDSSINSGNLIYGAGGVIAGADSDTVERHVMCRAAAGGIYLYSTGSTSGARGIYGYNASGTYAPILTVDQNNHVSITDDTILIGGVYSSSSSLRPVSDAGRTLGLSSYRWGKIYSSSSSIATSDEREKDIIGVANDDVFEQMFMALKPIKYRWKYQEQTDPGIHLGLGAQTVEQSMAALGLTTDDFAVIEHDTLEEVDEHGQADRYGMNYQQIDMLTLIMTQKNVRKIQELESEKETTAALLESLQYQLTQAFNRIAKLENQLNQLSA